MNYISNLLIKNGFVLALFITGLIMLVSFWVSERLTRRRIPGSAIAIITGLVLAYIGGRVTGGKNGIADIPVLSGFSIMGGAMFRDFAIVSTAMGASFHEIKKAGMAAVLSLFLGIFVSFLLGTSLAFAFGYTDPKNITTIGAGACTFIAGPVTGGAIGAPSEVITLSIAAGVLKAILVTIATPALAKYIGLNTPQTAMVYGGLMGTTSGVAAGLAATDAKLVPYGAITATFYTGLACLLCPSVFYFIIRLIA